jgi:hypothetical protein
LGVSRLGLCHSSTHGPILSRSVGPHLINAADLMTSALGAALTARVPSWRSPRAACSRSAGTSPRRIRRPGGPHGGGRRVIRRVPVYSVGPVTRP